MSKVFQLIKFIHCDADIFYRTLRKSNSEKYKTFYLAKRSGGRRLIEAPIDENLIFIQSKIKEILEKRYLAYKPSCVYGYISNSGTLANAKELTKNGYGEYILKVDLHDFFNTISYERICGLLKKEFKISDESANAICLLVTCHRHLPQGASTSPIISNMICKRMDTKLTKLAKSFGGIYTRYADDMFFSFKNKEKLLKVIKGDSFKKPIELSKTLEETINNNGFLINYKKVKILTKNNSQNICGIIVNEKFNVRRDFIRDLRIKIHKFKNGETINKKIIIGKLAYLRNVRGADDDLACKYCSSFNRLGIPPFPDADFRKNMKLAIKHYAARINLPNGCIGTGFFARGFLISSGDSIT